MKGGKKEVSVTVFVSLFFFSFLWVYSLQCFFSELVVIRSSSGSSGGSVGLDRVAGENVVGG